LRQVNLADSRAVPGAFAKYSCAVQERPDVPPVGPIRRADQRGASRRALRDHALRQPDRLGKQLGRNDCASILQKTLDEEKATDKKLTTLAESRVNLRGAS
jgi:hypothetical protein